MAREGARVQGQPGCSRTTTPPCAHHHRLCHVSRWNVTQFTPETKGCEGRCSATFLSNRAWDVPYVYHGARAPYGRRRRDRRCLVVAYSEKWLCPGNTASPGLQLLAAVTDHWPLFSPLWLQKTSQLSSLLETVATAQTCAHSTSNVCSSLGRHCNTTHPSQPSSFGNEYPHFAGDVHASVRASGPHSRQETLRRKHGISITLQQQR